MSLEMKYFVLKPGGNSMNARASRIAMRVYASEIRGTEAADKNDLKFADELVAWADREADAAEELA